MSFKICSIFKKKGKLAMGSNFGLGQRLEYGVISSEKRKKEKREE
jgi:hypothetical protein